MSFFYRFLALKSAGSLFYPRLKDVGYQASTISVFWKARMI